MDLYKQKDIKEEIYRIINTDAFPLSVLSDTITSFFHNMDTDFRVKVLQSLYNADYPDIDFENKKNVLDLFMEIYNSSTITDERKQTMMVSIAKTIADCSDNEDYCDNKIYVIIKNLSDDNSELIEEYDSWEEAEKKVDDWYIGGCGDIFIGENVLYPILCSVREREYDYCVNFCTIVELNASGLEDVRECWEERWENGEL